MSPLTKLPKRYLAENLTKFFTFVGLLINVFRFRDYTKKIVTSPLYAGKCLLLILNADKSMDFEIIEKLEVQSFRVALYPGVTFCPQIFLSLLSS